MLSKYILNLVVGTVKSILVCKFVSRLFSNQAAAWADLFWAVEAS